MSKYRGFGFRVNCDERTFVEFLKKHKASFDDELSAIFEYLTETEDRYMEREDVFEEYDYVSDESSHYGWPAAIANIMIMETGIRFGYYPGYGYKAKGDYILFTETMPWYMNEKEHALTSTSLREIMWKYAKELGVTENIDYFTVDDGN